MLSFFDFLVDSITSIFRLVGSFINSIVSAFIVVGTAADFSLRLVGLVPAIVGASISIVLMIYTLKFIVGR